MLTSNNNGSEVASIINQALEDAGSSVVIGNESGSSVSGKLNEVFGDDVLDDSQSGSAWAQAVEDGFDGMGGGDTPQPGDHETMMFLHISDTHGGTGCLQKCLDMLSEESDVQQVILSGDLCKYGAGLDGDSVALVLGRNKVVNNGVTTYYGTYGADTLTNFNGENKLLYVAGNHDRNDVDYRTLHLLDENDDEIATGISDPSMKLHWVRRFIKYVNGNHVNYGASGDNGAYWYKDFTKDGNIVRVIGMEDYERNSSVNPAIVCYYQAQVNWLLDLLANTPSSYHLLMVTHESPFKEPYGTHTAALSMAPQNSTEANGSKLFVSELQSSFHERSAETNVNLLPMIMQAYLEHRDINTTYTNNDGADATVVNVVKAFSEGNQPATLLGWLFGHNHRDIVGYMPSDDYDSQLLLGITAGDSSIIYSGGDDLLYGQDAAVGGGRQWAINEPSYRINELLIDFTAKTLTIKRIGNKTTADVSGRSYGGRVRDEITFPFKKGGES